MWVDSEESAFDPDPPVGVGSLLIVEETWRPVFEGALYEDPVVGRAAAELEPAATLPGILPGPSWGPIPICPPLDLIDEADPDMSLYV